MCAVTKFMVCGGASTAAHSDVTMQTGLAAASQLRTSYVAGSRIKAGAVHMTVVSVALADLFV